MIKKGLGCVTGITEGLYIDAQAGRCSVFVCLDLRSMKTDYCDVLLSNIQFAAIIFRLVVSSSTALVKGMMPVYSVD